MESGGVDWRTLCSSSEAPVDYGKAQESKANIEVSGDAKSKRLNNGPSIAERRAATCGFSAPRIYTARFRCISPSSSPRSLSPYLTIPAGLSPTSLLDSPVMLPNTQALPSPTTGTFSLPLTDENPMSVPLVSGIDKEKCDEVDSSFKFMSDLNPGGLSYLLGSGNQVAPSSNQPQILEVTDVNHQTLAHMQPNRDLECQNDLLKPTVAKRSNTDSLDMEISNSMTMNSKSVAIQKGISNVSSDQVPLKEEPFDGDDTGSQKILEGEQRGSYPSMAMGKPSEDGYNWRKYGQKQVKGSEYPRSYYKCTHPNCQVKKKVERSLDGQITEIIYKGAHNHQKPQPSRRSAVGSICSMNDFSKVAEGPGPCVKVEGGSNWKITAQGSKDNKFGLEWRADGLERTSSTSVLTELSDQLSNVPRKQLTGMESADTPELSSTLADDDDDDDDDDDVATQGSMSVGDGADDEESKRRKKESCLIETTLASRAIREPRIVVQTNSEIDILDDGYRWRKYGQKVVKGNPNPRSYYKCTSAGCPVRKHVERASHDLKSVLTTYEGKHNHEVPTARNSSHASSSGGNVSHAGPIAQTTLTLPRSTSFPKTEPQLQELAPCFERKPEFASEFMRPGYLGSFHGDMKLELPYFEMKLPPLPAIPYGSFGMNTKQNEANPVASIPQVVPDFPILMAMNMPPPGNLPFTRFNLSNHGWPVGPAQSYLGMQRHKETDTRFLRPKEERKDDAVHDTRLPMSHLAKASSSEYNQMMGGFPL